MNKRQWRVYNSTKEVAYLGFNLLELLEGAMKERSAHDRLSVKLLPEDTTSTAFSKLLRRLQSIDPNGDWNGAPLNEETLKAIVSTLRGWQAECEPYMYLYYEGMLLEVELFKEYLSK